MNLNSVSDMTQGDFLGSEDVKPDFYYNKGVSLLLIYTPKGKIFLKTLKKNFDLLISNASECTKKQPRVSFATEESPSRNEFWNDYNRRGFKYIIGKYTFLGKYMRFGAMRLIKKSIYFFLRAAGK